MPMLIGEGGHPFVDAVGEAFDWIVGVMHDHPETVLGVIVGGCCLALFFKLAGRGRID